jgi:hypothetical protein
MRRFLVGLAALSAVMTGFVLAADVGPKAGIASRPSLTLSGATRKRFHSISAALPEAVRARMPPAIGAVVFAARSKHAANLTAVAYHEAHVVAPRATSAQLHVLAYYLLVAAADEVGVPISSNANSEISQMSSMQLQLLMDTRSKLLQTVSNIEKTTSDTNMAIVGNIKQ